jgi:dolichol-phosphate mannosyltransferase
MAPENKTVMRPLVIIPTYDERENLPLLIGQLLAIPDLRILIVDDASPDGTGQLADEYAAANRARVQVLHRTGKRGLGLSYIDGMYVALRTDATHICQMDADLSHNPSDVPRLLAAAAQADFVIGSRYVPGGRIDNWPLHRRLLSAFANRYIRAITRLTIRDCTSGFRCWRREALEQLPLASIRSDGYAFIVELAWEASRVGLRCTEVPITFVERRQGASKLSGMVIIESAIVPWRLAARPK